MWKDPIVEEVRKVREENAAKFDFDLRRIFADAIEREKAHPERLVSFELAHPPKKRRRKNT